MRYLPSRAFTIIELLLALFLTSLLTASLSMMIGQAAKDRQAMHKPETHPAWMGQAIDHLEQDLRNAQGWAGADDRLVLVGFGRKGQPALIEYRWEQSEDRTVWHRTETPLTQSTDFAPSHHKQVQGFDLLGVRVGPHAYGKPQHLETPTDTPTMQNGVTSTTRPAIVVLGQRITLQPIPDQVEIVLSVASQQGDVISVNRKVVLR